MSPGTLLFAKASVVTAVLLILSQNVLQAVREYSAGAALICSINGNKTCVDRAQLVAKYVGANGQDAINGAVNLTQKIAKVSDEH